ncbi:MAG TPA: hypothetical protein PKK06_03130 [Phycisphaerae bacterium]|nr:hypothetical protein [Phycisphaerae bacterium]HNU44678.1 hypothetical protein [Phycisphaerae bacterium]
MIELTKERTAGAEAWASVVMRLAVASLFLSAAVSKWKGGWESVRGTVVYFQNAFAQTWLPAPLVTLHGYLTPFVEASIVVWLLIGWRLRIAWVYTSVFMISLAFGMSVAGKHDVAAQNFNYVLICCVGLYLSRFDRFHLGRRGQA